MKNNSFHKSVGATTLSLAFAVLAVVTALPHHHASNTTAGGGTDIRPKV